MEGEEGDRTEGGASQGLKGTGRGLYWIPKVTGPREGLNPFAGWGGSPTLLGTVPSQVSQGRRLVPPLPLREAGMPSDL